MIRLPLLRAPYPDRRPFTGGKALGLATPFGDLTMLAAFVRLRHSRIIDPHLLESNRHCPVDLNGVAARECGVTVERFQDRDADFQNWVDEHRKGYVINIGRSGRGLARLHRASCWTITSRPPFTGLYIKICSMSSAELDQ